MRFSQGLIALRVAMVVGMCVSLFCCSSVRGQSKPPTESQPSATTSAEEIDRLLTDLIGYSRHSEAAAKKRLKKIGKPIIPVIAERVRQERADQRMLWLLEEFPIDDTLEVLTQALDSKNEFVCSAAITTLGRTRSPKAVPVLIAFYDRRRNAKSDDKSSYSSPTSDCIRASGALIQIDDPRVMEKCLKELSHPHPFVRFHCAQFLAKHQRKEGITVLIDLLTDKTPLGDCFGTRLPEAVVPILRQITKHDFGVGTDGQKRWQKWWQQNKNKSPAQWAEESFRTAAHDLRSADKNLTANAIKRLALVGTPQAIRLLFDFANDPKIDLELGRAVVREFRFSNNLHTEEPLLAMLKHPDPAIRADAALALHNYKSKTVAEALIEALKDKDKETVRHAIMALNSMEYPAVVPALLPFLNHNDIWIRRCTIATLGRLGDKSVTPLLLEKLPKADTETAKTIATSLGQLKDPRAFPALIQLLRHRDKWVRWEVSQALESIADTEFDYYAPGTAKEREQDIRQIEKWWEQNKERLLGK